MAKYRVKAYASAEYGLKEQNITIVAVNLEDAKTKAYRMFDEYEEIGVWEESTEG